MDGIRCLEKSAGLFEHHREQSYTFRDAVDFETGAGNFAADSVENQRQPEACAGNTHNGSDDACGKQELVSSISLRAARIPYLSLPSRKY